MTNTTLVTYHGRADLKAAFLVEIGKHEAADQLVKGTYGKMNGIFRGCAIGCSNRSLNLLQGKAHDHDTGDHARVSEDLGWPLWLTYLEDNIFERLPDDQAKTWPRRLAEAIPVGVTVPDSVLARLLRWSLISDQFGVVHAIDGESVKAIVRRMGALFDRSIAGDEPSDREWNEAARDARDAWAARAARDAWDAWAARDAWDAWAARDAWDARAAWAARDAWAAFYSALSKETLRLLRELDVVA